MVTSVPPSVEQALSEGGIRFAYLFGSRATGNASDHSDVDIAVMPKGDLGLLDQEHGVLEPGLAERMRKLARLRKLLVHVYEEIDDRSVHASLAEGLDDLSRYAQAIARLMEQPGDGR